MIRYEKIKNKENRIKFFLSVFSFLKKLNLNIFLQVNYRIIISFTYT